MVFFKCQQFNDFDRSVDQIFRAYFGWSPVQSENSFFHVLLTQFLLFIEMESKYIEAIVFVVLHHKV